MNLAGSAATMPVVLGLDFGGTKIAAAVCDLAGRRLADVLVDSLPQHGADAALARGLSAAGAVLRGLGSGVRLAAVGAATFGIPQEDRVDLAPTIPGWEGVAFGRELRTAFPGVPVSVATDVKAAAAAELRSGALAGRDPAVYLNLGTGLAIAIVVGGVVVAGANRAAGEIGYLLRDVADVDAAPGARVLLEDVISGKALAVLGTARFGRPVTAADVFAMSGTDERAAQLVAQFARELALYMVNLAVTINPEVIVVGGGMVRSWDQIYPGLRRGLDAAAPFPPELALAKFPYDAPLVGALALGVQACVELAEQKSTPEEGRVE